MVSLLIPARNEAAVIEKCVLSGINQTYSKLEILVLDDESEDNTPKILKKIQAVNKSVRVITGSGPLPGWLGKPRACMQLSEAASGDLLLFIDADTWLEPNAITEIVESFLHENLDAITVWPQQHVITFWEKTVLPLVYFALITLLPVEYVKRDPRWLPHFFRPIFRTSFAAACGQCIGFSRKAYDGIGGHSSVKNEIVEDVELAKMLKIHGYRIAMYHGIGQVHCRMYNDHQSMYQGFRKNFFAGFGYSYVFFLLAAMLHIVVFILPYLLLAYSLMVGVSIITICAASSIMLIHLQRWILDRKNKWDSLFGLLHPLGVLWFQWLGITVLADRIGRRHVEWKGRSISSK